MQKNKHTGGNLSGEKGRTLRKVPIVGMWSVLWRHRGEVVRNNRRSTVVAGGADEEEAPEEPVSYQKNKCVSD